MRQITAVIFVLTCIIQTLYVTSAAEASDRAKAMQFLKDHVIGKTIVHESISKIDEGKVEAVFSRQVTFANLFQTSEGFAFDEIVVINQTNFDLGENGKRITPGQSKDRILVIRHGLVQRKSTGRLLGSSQIITSTSGDSGSTSFEQMLLEGDSLVMIRTGFGYGDYFAKGGKYKPGTSDGHTTFTVKNGKLQRVQILTIYDVNPDSMKRTPTGEILTLTDIEAEAK